MKLKYREPKAREPKPPENTNKLAVNYIIHPNREAAGTLAAIVKECVSDYFSGVPAVTAKWKQIRYETYRLVNVTVNGRASFNQYLYGLVITLPARCRADERADMEDALECSVMKYRFQRDGL